MQLVLSERPKQELLDKIGLVLTQKWFGLHKSRKPGEPAYFKGQAGIQFNGLELQVELETLEIDEAQGVLDYLIETLNPLSYYSFNDELQRLIGEDEYECSRYNLLRLPYSRP